jgi:hypothetical protein
MMQVVIWYNLHNTSSARGAHPFEEDAMEARKPVTVALTIVVYVVTTFAV